MAAALLLAGCGHAAGGGRTGTAGAGAEVTYYNHLVAAVNAYTRALQSSSATSPQGAPSGTERSALRTARATVAALRPPAGLADSRREILSIFDRRLALLPRELSAYTSHDPDALSALLEEDRRLGDELSAALATVRRAAAGADR